MKKLVFFAAAAALLLVWGTWAGADSVKIDGTAFPDKTFRNYVASRADEDGDGNLSEEEAAGITVIDMSFTEAQSLEGIRYFRNLKELYVHSSSVSSLDVSRNTALEVLWTNDSGITALDASAESYNTFCGAQSSWADAKPYMGFFYDELFAIEDAYPEQFAKKDIKAALENFLATYDASDDMTVWFEKIKAVADKLGYASDMKAYKQNPEAYPGNVADVSMFLRVALTGKFNSPDMYAVMQVLGDTRVKERILRMASTLS